MDWSKCVVCQKYKSDMLKCPKDRPHIHKPEAVEIYNSFLNTIDKFQELEAAPVVILFPPYISGEILFDNDARWHNSCRQQFTESMLARVISKKRKAEAWQQDDTARCSKRKSDIPATCSKPCVCVFCGVGQTKRREQLHEFATKNADSNLRTMATEMQDTAMLSKLASGDVIAIEARYHTECLTAYRNSHRSYIRSQNRDTQSDVEQQSKSRALVDLYDYIEEQIMLGNNIFKLKDLHSLHHNRLCQLGLDQSTNRTRLKNSILAHFIEYGIQEQVVNTSVILIFHDGVRDLIKAAIDNRDYTNEALLFSKVARLCRTEMFQDRIEFEGSFSKDCQIMAPNLTMLMSMLLFGPNIEGTIYDSQPCKTITQLVIHNGKRKFGKSSTTHASRHSPLFEPPVPVYVGLNIHTASRSKEMVENFERLGLSVSYKRILSIERSLSEKMCSQFEHDGLVCPLPLKHDIVTVGVIDNIDHNPSSSTATGSLHGTAITIMQHPTDTNQGRERHQVDLTNSNITATLPDSYTIVPALSLKPTSTRVPKVTTTEVQNTDIEKAIDEEKEWLSTASNLLSQNTYDSDEPISWSAFHAAKERSVSAPSAVIALLPLFMEKADSPAMIKHGMDIVMESTRFLNSQQTLSILACDCPIFAQCKYIQWKFPDTYGEDKLLIMQGGLHTEKALWDTLGDVMTKSGWTEALIDASIATSGTADSFLKASHITRTRHAHQVTSCALAHLQKEAYTAMMNDSDDSPLHTFDVWRANMLDKSPTFFFWDFVLRTELSILTFIRSHRENNVDLYVQSLEAVIFLFFALDHQNYSRWSSVHVRDLKALSCDAKDLLSEAWVVQKTQHRFSSMPLDQAHEQQNAIVKGKGGIIGLTENPSALKQWVISGPEKARLLLEFEDNFLTYGEETKKHHEENKATQATFHSQSRDLTETIKGYGNPFTECSSDLVILNSRDCASDDVLNSIKSLESVGHEKYEAYKKEVFNEQTKSIHDAIKRNSLPLFKTPKSKKSVKSKQLQGLRNDVALFGRLYIANQQREGDIEIFFSHENQLYPPSLSDNGIMHHVTKSDLLPLLGGTTEDNNEFDCKIFDGGALIHILKPTIVKTFNQYAHDVFIPFLDRELMKVSRVDVVWDTYLPQSIKASTREKRGRGARRKVTSDAKIPNHWPDFLRDGRNKTELFQFLSAKVEEHEFTGEVIITSGQKVNSVESFPVCDHEEADSRVVIHLMQAASVGYNKVAIRTVDTDVIVILVGLFFRITETYPDIHIYVAFGVGKNYRIISINSICNSLGCSKSNSLPFFHAFSGCDSTSGFRGKGKKSAWRAWQSFPEITDAFSSITSHPFTPVDLTSDLFKAIERYTVVMYDNTSSNSQVNQTRLDLFSKKSRNLEYLPPTQDALALHTARAVYQTGVWITAHEPQQNLPSPLLWGWEENEAKELGPTWMTLSEAAKACSELIKCSCKAKCVRCKCKTASLPCTELCSCQCEK